MCRRALARAKRARTPNGSIIFARGERLNGSAAPAKELYVYFASERYRGEHAVAQAEEEAARQLGFAEAIRDSGKHWFAFNDVDQLCRQVLRDGWKVEKRPYRPRHLPYTSLGELFIGRAAPPTKLAERFSGSTGRAAAIVCTQAIYGLGGVGKTWLAVEYALRQRRPWIVSCKHGDPLPPLEVADK